ncbi:MAG: M10 family metallopeptidase C-terminal domain-containing protein [Bauldia sp.]|nr:M10 family metallopeptidase C-terminal domain-containing protein [Bauldia sp.]
MATWTTTAGRQGNMPLAFAFVDNPIDIININAGLSATVSNNTTFNAGNGGVLTILYQKGDVSLAEASNLPSAGNYGSFVATRGTTVGGTLTGISPFAAFVDIDSVNAWKVLNGNDTLNGDALEDILSGGFGGNDTFNGKTGNDTFLVSGRSSAPTHTFNGGLGTDTVSVGTNLLNTALKSLDLRSSTFTSIEALRVGTGLTVHLNADQIVSGKATELSASAALSGGGVVDIHLTVAQTLDLSGMTNSGVTVVVEGSAGADTVLGTPGVDRIVGGGARDTLTGDLGNDIFDFNLLTDSGKQKDFRDLITDFTPGSDKIDLVTLDAKKSVAGDQGFKFIKKKDFHHKEGELRYEKINKSGTSKDVTLIEGDTNGNGKADFRIELKGLVDIGKGDFLL